MLFGLKTDQLLWIILLVNLLILGNLMMKQGEFYHNFQYQPNTWSNRKTGCNKVNKAEESGFDTDMTMMPFEVNMKHAPFEHPQSNLVHQEDALQTEV